jgi:hypothetical protein
MNYIQPINAPVQGRRGFLKVRVRFNSTVKELKIGVSGVVFKSIPTSNLKPYPIVLKKGVRIGV